MRLPDVTELFLDELQSRGVDQTWYCGPSIAPGKLRSVRLSNAVIIIPPSLGGGLIGKVATRLLSFFFETVYLVKQLWCKPDAILIRDKYWGAIIGYLVARTCGIPFLMWLSYPYPEHYREEAAAATGWKRWLAIARAWLGFTMLYPMMRRANHCFVQSEQMKKDLEVKHSIPSAQMTAVPMGVAKRLAEQAVNAAPSDPPTVIYLGHLAAIRKLDVVVDAFALVSKLRPNVRFLFVGDGDVRSERMDLEARVNATGISERVTFTGQLPQSEALALVRQASVCVSPVRNTPVLRVASPTKLIEYLALGKPTVANEHPEHSTIARECGGLLVCKWSATDFAAHITHLLDQPEEARQMAERGRQWVQRNRTYDRLADMVFSRLERVLTSPSTSNKTLSQTKAMDGLEGSRQSGSAPNKSQ